MKILFQGDSITDAGRDRNDIHDLGNGYPKFAAAMIEDSFPDAELEFVNLGISGNRTGQLFDRMYGDIIQINPDVISIMIGINDIWHRHGANRVETTDEQIAANYRAILARIKAQTHAKIIMIAPFLLDSPDKEAWRPELDSILPIIRSLADEFADAYIPLDKIFAEVLPTQPEPQYYSHDGVHPNQNGAAFIAEKYLNAIAPLIKGKS